MRNLLRRQRVCFSMSCVIAVGLFAALASWQHTIADDPSKIDEELAKEVELNVPRLLRVVERHTYSIKVTLTSKIEDPVSGPIYLVVQGTGVDKLAVKEQDGVTAGDEPFFRLLSENAKLLPSKRSISRTILISSEGSLRSSERRKFKLDFRLTRHLPTPDDDAVRRPRRTRRLPGIGNRETGRNGRGSNSGSRKPTANGRANEDDPPGAGKKSNSGEGEKNAKREPFELKPEIKDKDIKRVMKIQDNWTPKLLKREGVRGTATAVNQQGDLVIRIYTSRYGIAKNLPEVIEGIPVVTKVVGRFRPLFQPPQGKRGQAGNPDAFPDPNTGLFPIQEPTVVDDPTQRFPRPVPIGVSGINMSLPFCATGTIGCRLKGVDGTLYALSNNHVFADENSALIGDAILQPGPLDINCSNSINNSIGTLAAFVPIDFTLFSPNRVDAAVAKVTAATVSNRTPSGAYGMPNSHVVRPRLGMKVQKMGRTTVHTTGRVTALNFRGFVGYNAGLGFFVDQIEIRSFTVITDPFFGITTVIPKPFGGPGDSGSLVVTTYGNNPVALLFAGSVFLIIANPIDVVLEELGERVGQKLTIDGTRSNAGTGGR